MNRERERIARRTQGTIRRMRMGAKVRVRDLCREIKWCNRRRHYVTEKYLKHFCSVHVVFGRKKKKNSRRKH